MEKKAIQRAYENREYKKTQKRHLEKIADLKMQVQNLQQEDIDKKFKNLAPAQIIEIKQAQETRQLCVLLVIQAVVSYRSIPRILSLLNAKIPLNLGWIPHFTSVINWTLRLGLGLLAQVQPITKPWAAIIDHSIDIGTKKVLVVLRVTLDALSQRGAAIRLQDCECVGLKVCEKVNGTTISLDLEEIFNLAGMPAVVIKDCDYSLQKGVRLWSKKQLSSVPVIEDIGHVMATALKKQFSKTTSYQQFTNLLNQGSSRLRQTDLAFLIPPKLRTKGRFQSISKLGLWASKMLDVFAVKGRAKKDSLLARLRVAMPGFLSLKFFILRFAKSTLVVSQVMEFLKNKGLDQSSYEKCYQLSEELPKNSVVKKRLQVWLQRHLEIQKQVTPFALLVSSDIIESLFGNFKHILERSPQADMNRTALLIPALCGDLNDATISLALSKARHKDLKAWEQENIPYTVRKKREAFFRDLSSQKAGK